jgi:hypothetical protein
MKNKSNIGGARAGAGRPPKPASERKSRRIDVYVSEPDGVELDAWADREGRPLSELLAERGLRAARKRR